MVKRFTYLCCCFVLLCLKKTHFLLELHCWTKNTKYQIDWLTFWVIPSILFPISSWIIWYARFVIFVYSLQNIERFEPKTFHRIELTCICPHAETFQINICNKFIFNFTIASLPIVNPPLNIWSKKQKSTSKRGRFGIGIELVVGLRWHYNLLNLVKQI